MNEKLKKKNPYPLKIEGQGSWSVEDTFLKKNKLKNENIWYNKEQFGSYADAIISAGADPLCWREDV